MQRIQKFAAPLRIARRTFHPSFSSAANPRHDTPILIVGGGPSGLFLANLLQKYDQDFILLEAQEESKHFCHPQAHFLNTRTMELLRHATPKIYERVRESMQPVEEWNRFIFGSHMATPEPMAVVQHPVHTPLRPSTDANGILLQEAPMQTADLDPFQAPTKDELPLSRVSVGHLAQHTFSKILYQEAISNLRDAGGSDSQIYFGNRVVDAQFSEQEKTWQVVTNTGKRFQTSLVVAADGARSTWRQDHLGLQMSGRPEIQHLINVHFSMLEEPPHDVLPPAMLYTVFSSKVLSMVVRHGPTDYVMQIPYFPPYQTLEETFSTQKVHGMIEAALGSRDLSFQINSIRPWTMGSLVADSYAKNNVYLVGDAAHVFPPAGGFGMNTGLQDVAALAWRLKLQGVNYDEDRERAYTQERQIVARSNAALSVRNYERVLGVMQSCYLDHRNLPILMKSLETSKRFGMPFSILKRTFQNVFEAALLPLGILKESPSSAVSKHLKQNLRRLLGSGQGLPLLFPEHEVSFDYTDSLGEPAGKGEKDWKKDSVSKQPQLSIGRLFPHLSAKPIMSTEEFETYPVLCQYKNTNEFISTRDLPLQLSNPTNPCVYTLLEVCFDDSPSEKISSDVILKALKDSARPCTPARLMIGERYLASTKKADKVLLFVEKNQWKQLYLTDGLHEKNLHVLIRPDGHVERIWDDKGIANFVDTARGDAREK